MYVASSIYISQTSDKSREGLGLVYSMANIQAGSPRILGTGVNPVVANMSHIHFFLCFGQGFLRRHACAGNT